MTLKNRYEKPPMPRPGNRGLVFVRVTFAFLIVMLGRSLPTPLYPLYSARFGFSELMITIIYATYAAGVLAALIVAGVGRIRSDAAGCLPGGRCFPPPARSRSW